MAPLTGVQVKVGCWLDVVPVGVDGIGTVPSRIGVGIGVGYGLGAGYGPAGVGVGVVTPGIGVEVGAGVGVGAAIVKSSEPLHALELPVLYACTDQL